jgi:hypothetical protein
MRLSALPYLAATTPEQCTERDHDHLVHNVFIDLTKQCEWMHLAQDRDQWWAPVNMVMNLSVQKRWGIS